MTNLDPRVQAELQRGELRLRGYQARLGFWQALWGTIITGGVAVAIPAAVDSYKTYQERRLKEQEIALKDKELQGKILDSHQQYISNFLSTALNQDIELRIRFSEYFSFVSDPRYKDSWENFRAGLEKRRNSIREEINRKETQVDKLRANRVSLRLEEQIELAQLERELKWNYAELGYVRQDSSVTTPATLSAEEYGRDFNGSLEPVTTDALARVFGLPSTTNKTKPDECNELNGTKLRANLAEFVGPTGDRIEVIRPAADSLKRIMAKISNEDPELFKSLSFAQEKCLRYSESSKSFDVSAWRSSVTFGGRYRTGVPVFITSLFGSNSASLMGYDPFALISLTKIARYFRDEQWYWAGGDRIRRPNTFLVSGALLNQWVDKGEIK